MTKRSTDVVNRFPGDFWEAVLRSFKEVREVVNELGSRFDPDDPRWRRTLIVIAAILLATVVLQESLKAWLTLGWP
jgi:hypothetical protein